MAVQNEVQWLLDTLKNNYPATWPDTLVRRNRDDSVTLDKPDSPIREMGVSLDRYNTVGVSSGSKTREVFGTKPQYDVQTTLDVRVEAKHESEWGETADIDGFDTLVAYLQNAVNQELTYPSVDPTAESIGFVDYTDARITDTTQLSSGDKDYYRTDFTVLLTGRQDTP